MNNRPHIFIDVDGVFNRYTFAENHANKNLDDDLLERFAGVVRELDAVVVELSCFNYGRLTERMNEHGVTSLINLQENERRGLVSANYVRANNIKHWAILDDESGDRWCYDTITPGRMIYVDGSCGFSEENATDLFNTLKGETCSNQLLINLIKYHQRVSEVQKNYIDRLIKERTV